MKMFLNAFDDELGLRKWRFWGSVVADPRTVHVILDIPDHLCPLQSFHWLYRGSGAIEVQDVSSRLSLVARRVNKLGRPSGTVIYGRMRVGLTVKSAEGKRSVKTRLVNKLKRPNRTMIYDRNENRFDRKLGKEKAKFEVQTVNFER